MNDLIKIHSVSLAKVQLKADTLTLEVGAVAYSMSDELPFDYYGLYGEDDEGCSYHLADFETYKDARMRLADCVAELNERNGKVSYKDLLGIANR